MDMTETNVPNKKTLIVIAITLVIFGLFILNAANAQGMSKNKYQALGEGITKEFKAAKGRCESLVNNFRELCDAKAEGVRDISKAELEASFKPTIQNRYDANIISAASSYSISSKQCDGLTLSVIRACKSLTKETYVRDTANARSIRNSEKLSEIKKDKTVLNDDDDDDDDDVGGRNNIYMYDEFNSVYLVKA